MGERISAEERFVLQTGSGIFGYGEKGKDGEQGIRGNGVFYSSETDPSTMVEKIIEGKPLSNNPNSNFGDRNYMDGDTVLDSLGNTYVINDNDIILTGNLFSDESPNVEAECSLATEYNTILDARSYSQPNPMYKGKYNNRTCSPYIFHRTSYYRRICGNWIRFKVKWSLNNESESIYIYKITLPTGECIKKVSTSPDEYIFVENSMLVDCGGEDNENIKNKIIGDAKDIERRENDKCISECCAKILKNCDFSVEVCIATTSKTYVFNAVFKEFIEE